MAQEYFKSELKKLDDSRGRCLQMCQDDVKDKVIIFLDS